MFGKRTLVAAVLGACLLVGAAPSYARERNNNKCEQRVRKAEQKLNDAVRKHGERSRQAEQRRRDLERERANCNIGEHRDHDRH